MVVLLVGCYNAFSAGASNAANAIAPLVGSGSITASHGILLAIAAIGLGGFTIARRTLDTVGEGLTDLPILAAMIVSLIGATIITVLSNFGLPASLAVSMTSCIIGLGWGRSSRHVTVAEATSTMAEETPGEAARIPVTQTGVPDLSTDALLAESAPSGSGDAPGRGHTIGELATEQPPDATEIDPTTVPRIGTETPEELLDDTPVMFDRVATEHVVFLWLLTPTLATIGSYVVFVLLL